jgi:hypothetical protein
LYIRIIERKVSGDNHAIADVYILLHLSGTAYNSPKLITQMLLWQSIKRFHKADRNAQREGPLCLVIGHSAVRFDLLADVDEIQKCVEYERVSELAKKRTFMSQARPWNRSAHLRSVNDLHWNVERLSSNGKDASRGGNRREPTGWSSSLHRQAYIRRRKTERPRMKWDDYVIFIIDALFSGSSQFSAQKSYPGSHNSPNIVFTMWSLWKRSGCRIDQRYCALMTVRAGHHTLNLLRFNTQFDRHRFWTSVKAEDKALSETAR